MNRDAGAGGINFSSSAVHSLTPFVHELAQSIRPAGETKNLYDGWLGLAVSIAAFMTVWLLTELRFKSSDAR